jgi:hypothetical protein
LHEKYEPRWTFRGIHDGIRTRSARTSRGLRRSHHLHGWHDFHGHRKRCVQRSWRRPKDAKGGRPGGACSSRGACARRTRSGRRACGSGVGCNQNVRGWHDLHGRRKGCVQRSWRRSERDARRGLGYRRPCGDGAQGDDSAHRNDGAQGGDSVHRDGRQYRPDGSDRQVQGRDLFEVAAPLRHVLEPRRRCGVADRSVARGGWWQP